MSKFRPSEFFPYARHFYNPDGLSKPDYDNDYWFEKAWLLHQHRNPHHWQHWVLEKDNGETICIPIKPTYLKEMVCDWIGAGKAQGYFSPPEDPYLETRNWFLKNKENIKLSYSDALLIKTILRVEGNEMPEYVKRFFRIDEF